MENNGDKNNKNEEDKKLDERGDENDEKNNNEEDEKSDKREKKENQEKRGEDGGSEIKYNFSFLNNNNGENSNSFINFLADSPNDFSADKDKKTNIENGGDNIINNMRNYIFDEFSFSEDHGSGDSKNKKNIFAKLGK